MVWSIAVLDQGISNWFERTYRRNVYEYDIYYWDRETDYGVDKTHGTQVAMSARSVQPALGFIDLKIMNSAGWLYSSDAELALTRVLQLSREGYGIGAINLSWGGFSYPWQIVGEIADLAKNGIFSVAAAGNSGTASSLEVPAYPASLPDVIAVGSHDGAGNPSAFSNNYPGYITVLADGEDMPEGGVKGTSFAAPQVAATVATLQAYARYGIGRTLTLGEMRDALQQGGGAPRSNPDPADGRTRYFLHDHNGIVRYFRGKYLDGSFEPLSYIASHRDLIAALGNDAQAGLSHFLGSGAFEERAVTFDGLSYLAANADVAAAVGASASAGAAHYIASGRNENRRLTFDWASYLAANTDLIAPLGTGSKSAMRHYIEFGQRERRATSFDAYQYLAANADLITAFGGNANSAIQHYISGGYREGRSLQFDAASYLSANPDLRQVFAGNTALATRHYAEYGFREGRLTNSDVITVSEGATDLPGTTATTGRLSLGGQVSGRLSDGSIPYLFSTDSDWYLLRLPVGQRIEITVRTNLASTGLFDGPTLQLMNASGISVASTTMTMGRSTATLTYTVRNPGTHYVAIDRLAFGSDWSNDWTYTITARQIGGSGLLADPVESGLLAVGV